MQTPILMVKEQMVTGIQPVPVAFLFHASTSGKWKEKSSSVGPYIRGWLSRQDLYLASFIITSLLSLVHCLAWNKVIWKLSFSFLDTTAHTALLYYLPLMAALLPGKCRAYWDLIFILLNTQMSAIDYVQCI